MSDSVTHGLQHSSLPCSSLSLVVCSNSCPWSWWCFLTISSTAAPFSCYLKLFPTSESFPVSQLCIRWPKYWSLSFSITPCSEYSRMISFRIDWFDFLAVQGTLKSLLQHHDSKASVLWCLAFFIVQLTSLHDYWKNHSFDYMEVCQQSDVSDF